MKRTDVWVVLFILVPQLSLKASTGAGNGGDILDRFLQATRQSLVESLEEVSQHPEKRLCHCESGLDSYCRMLRSLTERQQAYCEDFIRSNIESMLTLNKGAQQVPFSVTSERIYVKGPSGEDRPVSAITPLGPGGTITFQYNRVESMSPVAVLALMAHEFGHKVFFEPIGTYVEDNPSIGPFEFVGGGRRLLDSVGAAIALFAVQHSKIGSYFSLEDRFSCEIADLRSSTTFRSVGNSPRVVNLGKEEFVHYKASIGNHPQDFRCELTKHRPRTTYSIRLTINENGGCDQPVANNERWTQIELWQTRHRLIGHPIVSLIQRKHFSGQNPLCDDVKNKGIQITLDERFQFTINHLGTVAKTGFFQTEALAPLGQGEGIVPLGPRTLGGHRLLRSHLD